ncbi:UBX domain-containing protein 6 [Spea bombifrons]|uniref:UBX domain-containing protein 6 n=1 Tax=Spea bombifrons TaxID=233779 RepID=UPI00234B0863|nr:UBX domain-containing protein 6 [Spea bombifrons]
MKKFFQGIKSDIKFKTAGPGHKLSEDRREDPTQRPNEPPKPRKPPTGEAQIAAATAAMARIESQQVKSKVLAKDPIKAQVKKELEAALEKEEAKSLNGSTESRVKEPTTVCNILFRCPLTSALLKKEERERHIAEVLQTLSATDPTSGSIMKIHTFNKDREKVKVGVETIGKYLDNIINHPEEKKYSSIRLSNKVFQDRISCLEGALEFFEAIGFERETQAVPGQEAQEEFLVLSSTALERLDTLQNYKDALLTAEPVRATLERQARIFTPSIQAAHFDLPDDFYNLTAEEIKREQRQRAEAVERNAVLRTKAMREREEQREMKKYNYTVIRIRLPDGYILQGMFYARERVSALLEFVRERLQNDWLPFELLVPCGQKLDTEEAALNECGLVPSALLTFRWDVAVMTDIKAAVGTGADNVLKPELLTTAETLF